MANRSDPYIAAESVVVHGTHDPQKLVGGIVRSKIYQSSYWKEQCFGLSAATLVDKAAELDHFGGTLGGTSKPTPFLCLTLKLLQLHPDKQIIAEFILNQDHKYLRILAALYLRLVGKPVDIYLYLEPMYNDYRKLRQKMADGSSILTHVDEFIEELLYEKESCNIALPHLPKRWTLEVNHVLKPRLSALDDEYEDEADDDNADPDDDKDVVNGTLQCVREDTYHHHGTVQCVSEDKDHHGTLHCVREDRDHHDRLVNRARSTRNCRDRGRAYTQEGYRSSYATRVRDRARDDKHRDSEYPTRGQERARDDRHRDNDYVTRMQDRARDDRHRDSDYATRVPDRARDDRHRGKSKRRIDYPSNHRTTSNTSPSPFSHKMRKYE